jgi:hypothetical protein
VAVSWTVKAQHPIASGKKVHESAARKILDHRPVAVEQDNARGGRIAPLPVVEPHALAYDKISRGRVSPLGQEGKEEVPGHEENHDNEGYYKNGFKCGHEQVETSGCVMVTIA